VPHIEGRYLLDATSPEDTLAFLLRNTETAVDAADLAARTAAAREIRSKCAALETLAGPGPTPAAWQDHLDRVAARPLFQRMFAGMRWQFASVPLRSLISVQPHVNLTFAHSRVAACESPAALLECCLPAQPEPLELWGGVSPGEPPSASFTMLDPNIRVTEVRMEAAPRLSVIFTISKTAVFLQVLRLEGRLFLKNGIHRAAGLLAAGRADVPCVLVEAADLRELPDLLPLPALLRPDPPMVADFLHPGLSVPHTWRERVKFIRLVPEEFMSPLPPT